MDCAIIDSFKFSFYNEPNLLNVDACKVKYLQALQH